MKGGAALSFRASLAGGAALALLIFAAFRITPFLAAAEATARDLHHAAFVAPAPPRDDIVLVLIEETTLSKFPYRSPIDRAFVAELIAGLSALSPAVIGVDLLFDQPTEEAKDFPLFDLLDAAEDPPVFVVVGDEEDGLTSAQTDWLMAMTGGMRVAQAALLRDPFNDATRAAPAAREIRGRDVPAFSVALARAAGASAGDESYEIFFTPPEPGADFTKRYVAGFHQYLTAEQIEGKIVLIGALLSGADRHRTPLDAISDGELTPGVEAHAQAVAQLMDGKRLIETPIWSELALAALSAGLVVLAMHAPVGVVAQTVLVGLVLAMFVAGPAVAIGSFGLRGPVIPPVLAGAAIGGAIALVRWRTEANTRRRLREAFGKFVAPEVVKEIEAQPDALRLGGERREVTCVFTDVAGFTTLCEGLDAEELCELLNRYLGGASDVFIRHGGTIDKFVGDAIVGFFGAPIPREDHAAAAIRMAAALDRFAADFVAAEAREGRAFGVTRIGVHTGQATVGNFGGDLFFDYTAMGDTVNVAARLEGANKAFGGTLCVSGDAAAAAGAVEGVLMRPIGELRVKGRAAPLPTFEAFTPGDAKAAYLDAYLDAFEALAGDGARALSAFSKLADAHPDDKLVALHHERLLAGETGGVVTLTEK